jgi:hypothetical protein
MATQPSPQPTREGFVAWVYGIMGIPVEWLPVDSDAFGYAYDTATALVNPAFICVPGPIYLQMVYNLAGHLLVTWTQDIPAPPVYITVDGVDYGYFQYLRKQNNVLGFVTGIVSSSSDEGTSVSLVVPKQAENLTLGQLQMTTTIWGRTYLGYAQSFGTNWGIS